MNKPILLITLSFLLFRVCYSLTNKQFGKSQYLYQTMSKQNKVIPTPQNIQFDEETKELSQSYKHVNYSPQYNTQFTLSNTRTSESLFHVGQQGSILQIQVIVMNRHDQQTLLQTRSKPIILTVLETSSNQVLVNIQIHKHRLITIKNLKSQLYKLTIQIQHEQNNDQYLNKTVMVYSDIFVEKQQQINKVWLKQYAQKVNGLYEQSTMLFFDSLQDWTVIQKSFSKYKDHQQKWKLYSILQLVGLVVLTVIQLLYFKKVVQSDILIV